MVRNTIRSLAHGLLGDYRLYRIYEYERPRERLPARGNETLRAISEQDMETAEDEKIREHSWYGGDDSHGFGGFVDNRLVATCWFWGNQRFRDEELFVLKGNEAVLVDLITSERYRGMGIAPRLIEFAAVELANMGVTRLVTWIWHSNRSSIRAFEKAGWKYKRFFISLNMPFVRRRIRLSWKVLSR